MGLVLGQELGAQAKALERGEVAARTGPERSLLLPSWGIVRAGCA